MRAGTYPRMQARQAERRSLRKNWWRLAVISLIPFGGAAVIALVWPAASIPMWALPAVLWCVLLGGAWSQIHGSYALEMGGLAEVWTSKELSKLERDGARHFDHVLFDRFDVDHVLVHPSGVFVLETKYTDRKVDLGGRGSDAMLRDWRDDAVERAEKIRRFLVTSKRLSVDIAPLVVVWGSDIEGVSTEVDGVVIVRGGALIDLIESSEGPPKLDLRGQKAICYELASFITQRDAALRK